MSKKICILTNNEDNIFTLPLLNSLFSKLNDKSYSIIFLKGFNSYERTLKTILSLSFFDILKILILKIKYLFTNNNINNFPNKIYFFDNINSIECSDFIFKEKFDLIIALNCPQIISKNTLNKIKSTFVNFHPGELPKYRGVFTVFYALLNKEKFITLSFHIIDNGIDTGRVLNKIYYSIEKKDTLFSLYKKLYLSNKSKSFIIDCITNFDLIKNNEINTKTLNNYYSFPKIFDILKFKLRIFF